MRSSRYNKIRDTFPDWTGRQCQEYIHGIDSFEGGLELDDDMMLDENEDLLFSPHFLYGYADAMGREAEAEDWFRHIDQWVIQPRWWGNTRL